MPRVSLRAFWIAITLMGLVGFSAGCPAPPTAAECTRDSDCVDAFRNKCLTVGTRQDGSDLGVCLHESAKGARCCECDGGGVSRPGCVLSRELRCGRKDLLPFFAWSALP